MTKFVLEAPTYTYLYVSVRRRARVICQLAYPLAHNTRSANKVEDSSVPSLLKSYFTKASCKALSGTSQYNANNTIRVNRARKIHAVRLSVCHNERVGQLFISSSLYSSRSFSIPHLLKRRALQKIAVLSASSSNVDIRRRQSDFTRLCDACPTSRSRHNGSTNGSNPKDPSPTTLPMVHIIGLPK